MSLTEVPDPLWVNLDTGEGRMREALRRSVAIFDEMGLEPTTGELIAAAVALLSVCDTPDPRFRLKSKGKCSQCLVAPAMSGSETCGRCSL